MIFLNSRPVDENVHYERPSISHKRNRRTESSRMVLILMLFYLLASAFPLILYYPVSLVSLIVPAIMLTYALCIMNGDMHHDVWPCCLVGVTGIMIKLGGLIVYLSIFNLKDEKFDKRYKNAMSENNAKTLFFGIMVSIEVIAIIVAGCLKWQLIAFENDRHSRKHDDASKQAIVETA